MRKLITVILIFSSLLIYSQEIANFKTLEKELGVSNSDNTEYSHVYMITYIDETGRHTHKPNTIRRSKGESMESVKKRAAEQEEGRKYKLNVSNAVNKDYPYGLLYMNTKEGKIKYLLGTYTTREYAEKMWKEKEKYGSVCIEIISLN